MTVGVLIDLRVVVDNLACSRCWSGWSWSASGRSGRWSCLLFRQPLSTALLVGVGLAQIGEFSFILVQVARQAGHVGDDVYSATLAASLVTILINAALVRLVPRWIGPARLDERRRRRSGCRRSERSKATSSCAASAAWAARSVRRSRRSACPYVAIESDPDIVKSLRARNVPAVFGDAAQQGHLAAAQANHAALVILAIPENDRARQAVRRIRAFNPTVQILARVHDLAWRARLVEAGAAEVIQPEEEAASTLIRHALERLSLPARARAGVSQPLSRHDGARPGRGGVKRGCRSSVRSVSGAAT